MRNKPGRGLCVAASWSVSVLVALLVFARIQQHAARSYVRHIASENHGGTHQSAVEQQHSHRQQQQQPKQQGWLLPDPTQLLGRGSSSSLGSRTTAQQQQQETGGSKPDASTQGGPPAHPVTAASSSVLFGLMGRNVGAELPYVLANIGRLAARFQQAHVVFVENDSYDATRAVFGAWAANFTRGFSDRTARLVPLKLDNPSENRMTVLAKARNIYVDQLGLREYRQVSLLIAVDADMCHAWDVDRMVEVIDGLLPAMATEWHVLTANGVCGWYQQQPTGAEQEAPPYTAGSRAVYCDLLSLRSKDGRQFKFTDKVSFVPGTCDMSHMGPSSASSFACHDINSQAVVPVKSGFGGLALYDASMFRPGPEGKACRYDENPSTCEHWSLSDCLERQVNAKQFIATGLLINWEGCTEEEQHKWDSSFLSPASGLV